MNQIIVVLVSMVIIAGCGGKGADGINGTNGANGAIGADGADGRDSVNAVSTTFCSKSSGGLLFNYRFTLFSGGDVLVSCDILDTSTQYSNTSFYKSIQTGANTGGCILAYDVDVSTSGFWNFTTSPTRGGVYTDAGSASNGSTVLFSDSDCTTN